MVEILRARTLAKNNNNDWGSSNSRSVRRQPSSSAGPFSQQRLRSVCSENGLAMKIYRNPKAIKVVNAREKGFSVNIYGIT